MHKLGSCLFQMHYLILYTQLKALLALFRLVFFFNAIQEPGTNAEIKAFAQGYNAQFDMFSKIDVNGDNAHPLWKWMKMQPKGKGLLGK